jgi:hypothetical protein
MGNKDALDRVFPYGLDKDGHGCEWMSSSHNLLSWLATNKLYTQDMAGDLDKVVQDLSDSFGKYSIQAVNELRDLGFISLRRCPYSTVEFQNDFDKMMGHWFMGNWLKPSCMDLRHVGLKNAFIAVLLSYYMELRDQRWHVLDHHYLLRFLNSSFIPVFTKILKQADLMEKIHSMVPNISNHLENLLWEVLFLSYHFRLYPVHLLSLDFVSLNLKDITWNPSNASMYTKWRIRFTKKALILISSWIKDTEHKMSNEFNQESYNRVMKEVDGITEWIKLISQLINPEPGYLIRRMEEDIVHVRKAMTFMLLSGDKGHKAIYNKVINVISTYGSSSSPYVQSECETMMCNHDVILRMILSKKPVRSGYDDIDRLFFSLESNVNDEVVAWIDVLSCYYRGPVEYEVALNGLIEYRQ